MKIKELIKELQKFNPEHEVTVSDGWRSLCYSTKKITLVEWKENDGSFTVDIGIGGNHLN